MYRNRQSPPRSTVLQSSGGSWGGQSSTGRARPDFLASGTAPKRHRASLGTWQARPAPYEPTHREGAPGELGNIFWSRMPSRAKAFLAARGICSLLDLLMCAQDRLRAWMAEVEFKHFARLVQIILEAAGEESYKYKDSLVLRWEREVMKVPAWARASTVHQALGLEDHKNSKHRAGATPLQVLGELEEYTAAGGSPAEIADEVAQGRVASSIMDSTAVTYSSHLRMVERACMVFEAVVCPADIVTVRRVAAVCNNPMTLRGWLASWRRLHMLRGFEWAGDKDPLLRAIRSGTARRLPLQPPKRRVRLPLLQALLKEAIRTEEFWLGAAFCLAYVFALRVPSELLGQGHRSQFVSYADRVCLVRLKRKGQRQLTELVRSCTCSTNRLVCPHLWLDYVKKEMTGDRLFAMTTAFFHTRLWALLAAVWGPQGGVLRVYLARLSPGCCGRHTGATRLVGNVTVWAMAVGPQRIALCVVG